MRRQGRALPRGISRRSNGSYQVAVTPQGSKSPIRAGFATLGEAELALQLGRRAKASGGDIRTAMMSARNREASESDLVAAASKPTAPAAPTVAHVVSEHLARRDELAATSDHTLRAKRRKGEATLRPRTAENDHLNCRNRLLPYLGGYRTTDLTYEILRDWTLKLAEDGLGTKYVDSLISKLRSVIGELPSSQRPESFPWNRLRPIKARRPRKQRWNPVEHGLAPNTPEPLITFAQQESITTQLPRADRIVPRLEGMAGLRRGEIYGLQLGDFTKRDGYWWVNIRRQRDLDTGEIVPWVKSDASYRTIPLAPILGHAIETYVVHHHSTTLDSPKDPEVLLVVSSVGRSTDGGFLPGLAGTTYEHWTAAANSSGYSPDKIGFFLDLHHLRKCLSTYLQVARQLVPQIRNAHLPELPPDAPAEDRARRLEQEIEQLNADRRAGFSLHLVSVYLGHEVGETRSNGELPAAAITNTIYRLDTGSEALVDLADVIDLIVRHEVDELDDEPLERDTYRVVRANDPDWILIEDAAPIVGLTRSGLYQAVQAGNVAAELAWVADGGYQARRNAPTPTTAPTFPRLVIHRDELDRVRQVRSNLSHKEAASRLGVSPDLVRKRFIAQGWLDDLSTAGGRRYVAQEQVDSLAAQLHELVLEALRRHVELTTPELVAAIAQMNSPLLHAAPRERWVDHWTAALRSAGAVVRSSHCVPRWRLAPP